MTDHSAERRRAVVRLGLLFGALYFIQGIVEPGTGLMYQPVQSLLKGRGYDASAITAFTFWLGLPWSFKPVFGLLCDFVPLFGSRRQSWLILSSSLTAGGYLVLTFAPGLQESHGGLLGWLLVANVGIAFSDVAIDAVMIERGQPLGATGRFQSIQWACMMGAVALAGIPAGWLSHAGHRRQAFGFAACALLTSCSVLLAVFAVREPSGAIPRQGFRSVARSLWRTARSRTILTALAFLFLWNFNPFSTDVLYLHLTEEVGLSEQFYGTLTSIQGVAAILASALYGVYCTRIRFPLLVHASIVLGILSTVGYWALDGRASAVAITWAVGFTYQTATMIQLDLAARVCPPQVAGTVFAMLMAISNFSTDLSKRVGGPWYDRWKADWGATASFNALVAVGAAFTAGCWIITPWLLRSEDGPATPPSQDG